MRTSLRNTSTRWLIIDYDFIGSVENMEGVVNFLCEHHLPFRPWQKHATNAALLLKEHYCEQTEALATKIYAEDFRVFGYKPGLHRAVDPPECGNRVPPMGVRLSAFAAAPAELEQSDTPDLEAWRAFQTCREWPKKIEIAGRALEFADWQLVQRFLAQVAMRSEYELTHDLAQHLILLVTRHMDVLPESLLSAHGRRMKRKREKILYG